MLVVSFLAMLAVFNSVGLVLLSYSVLGLVVSVCCGLIVVCVTLVNSVVVVMY